MLQGVPCVPVGFSSGFQGVDVGAVGGDRYFFGAFGERGFFDGYVGFGAGVVVGEGVFVGDVPGAAGTGKGSAVDG